AIAAGQKLTFDPALRNGVPIAAKIKHKYVFAPPPARLVGKALAADSNKPLVGASVILHAADGTEQATQAAENGAWAFINIPAGNYRITIAASGFKTQTVEQDVAPGEEVKNVLRLSPEGVAVVTPVKPGEEEEEEIQVKGVRPAREVTRRTLERREMNRIPGTNGDALRSLQNLPGVARPPALLGLLIVRGSAPQDTSVFVDGTLIPLVYHVGGLSSVVPTEMLEKIDFYPGNFSTQYGRAMGGIVDVGMRDPRKDALHGMAQVDFIDARVLAEGPIVKDSGWSFAVAGRRSYVDVWLKPVLVAAGTGVTTAPVYYDYQAMIAKDFGKNTSLRVLFFGSDDKLDLLIKSANASDPALAGVISAHTGFWRLQGRFKSKLSKDTDFRLMAAVGEDFIDFSLGDNFFTLRSHPITTRAELAQKIAPGLTANVGMDMLYAPYDVHVRFPPQPRPGEAPSGPGLSRPPLETTSSDAIYQPALFTEFEITPWKGGRLVPGARLDYAKDTKQWDVAPRVIARQDLTTGFPRTTAKGGAGVFYQPPQPVETNAVFGQPGLHSNRAIHYDVGVEQEITHNVNISVEGFYKQFDHLVVPRLGNQGRGHAYGIETLLRYTPDARFFGWVAYTISRSVRQDTASSPVNLIQFDQTHILTVLGSYRLGRGWEFGGRFRLVSGSLYTPNAYGFTDENAAANLPLQSYPPLGERLPMFHQLDIRLDKTWTFKSWKFGFYADIQNVYNRANAEGVSYNYNNTQRSFASGLPILPSLGIRGEF
ncbi:MAG: carboxypeptidase regulatory-like domain-containing protein, partial [Polyangiaceae bacterium]